MRISSFSHINYLYDQSSRTHVEMNKAQQQTASGLKSETFSGIAPDSNRLLRFESEKNLLESEITNTDYTLDHMESMYGALNQINDLSNNILGDMTAALGGAGTSSANLSILATQWRTDLESMLNADFAGRYLFSGTATDAPPVDIAGSGYGGQTAPSVADTSYYQGDDGVLTYKAGNASRIEYGLSANDETFEQMFRAIDLMITAPGDQAALAEAYDLMRRATDSLGIMKQNLSYQTSSIQQTQEHNLAQAEALDILVSDLKDADLAEATIKLSELQTQLEASYSSLTIMLKISLFDYL